MVKMELHTHQKAIEMDKGKGLNREKGGGGGGGQSHKYNAHERSLLQTSTINNTHVTGYVVIAVNFIYCTSYSRVV